MDFKTQYLETVKLSLMDGLNTPVPKTILSPQTLEEQSTDEWFNHFWFGKTLTMCSQKRLDNVQFCIESCIGNGVPGDLIECGVWRGGVSILMRAVLAAHQVNDRTVWVADSFQGLPKPNNDLDQKMYKMPEVQETNCFSVPLATVESNFHRYGLLDEQVQFLPGWFSDTLPSASISKLSVLRVDGDFYDSTIQSLRYLYPKVSTGGYIIIDDWGLSDICGEKAAVLDYRKQHNITDPIIEIDYHSAYWQKGSYLFHN